MITHQKRPWIFSLDDVLQPDECHAWIGYAEGRGFIRAPLNDAKGADFDDRVRNNQYLNDGYGGGETWFRNVTVTPKRGSALLFEHHLEHAGVAVAGGRKYVLRTDVMYFPDFTGEATGRR